jgi:DNA polymerase beta
MDITQLRMCKKSPGAGGMSRQQVNELAVKFGLDPKQFSRKDDLCDAIMRVAQQNIPAPAAAGAVPTPPATPTRRNATNVEIGSQLRALADRFNIQGETYRSSAMANAARAVERFPNTITDPDNQLKGIPGIGTGVLDRIREYLTTGKLAELAGIAEPTAKGEAIKELKTVYGVGDASADKFYDSGIHSVADLVNAFNEKRINLTTNQELGLRYYDDFRKRIPRDEVTQIGNFILDVNKVLDPNNTGDIVGSYRRGRPDSGDVDVLITNPEDKNYLADIVAYLKEQNFLPYIMAEGDVSLHATYWSGLEGGDKILRKIDIRYVPPESYGAALLHATGSDQHNVKLRLIALGMRPKLSLSEFGLIDVATGAKIPTVTEEDVFKALGTPFVPPEERN